jgi:hypothetical protein
MNMCELDREMNIYLRREDAYIKKDSNARRMRFELIMQMDKEAEESRERLRCYSNKMEEDGDSITPPTSESFSDCDDDKSSPSPCSQVPLKKKKEKKRKHVRTNHHYYYYLLSPHPSLLNQTPHKRRTLALKPEWEVSNNNNENNTVPDVPEPYLIDLEDLRVIIVTIPKTEEEFETHYNIRKGVTLTVKHKHKL